MQIRLSVPKSHAGVLALAAALAVPVALPAQSPGRFAARPAPPTNKLAAPALDPVTMQALRTMSDQLRGASSYSFTARIMREEPGTNGQMLDFFRTITVQVQRPNKMRWQVQSDTSDVNVWYDGKNVTIMPLTGKMYTTIPAGATIDAALETLKNQLQVHMPLRPFLSADPYSFLSDGLTSANSVGMENAGNQQYLHLAFTEPEADWQLWLSGPNQVLPQRMAITYKNEPGQPRVEIEFSNWCLNAEIPTSAFVFSKPAGALPAALGAVRPRTPQQGGQQ